jgi:transposase-like protein
MPEAHSLPDRVNIQIQRPVCPKCSAHMMLARIMPARLGFDLRTFECPKCNYVHEAMVATDAFGSPFSPAA